MPALRLWQEEFCLWFHRCFLIDVGHPTNCCDPNNAVFFKNVLFIRQLITAPSTVFFTCTCFIPCIFWHILLTVSFSVLPSSLANIPLTPETARDQERRIRREIANSNERRRMQSINAGFQSLKTLIPHSDGEKLSKVGLRKFQSDELKWASSCFYGKLFKTWLHCLFSP